MTSVDALRGEFRQLLRELHRKRIQQAMMTLGVASTEELGIGVHEGTPLGEGGAEGMHAMNDEDGQEGAASNENAISKVDVHFQTDRTQRGENVPLSDAFVEMEMPGTENVGDGDRCSGGGGYGGVEGARSEEGAGKGESARAGDCSEATDRCKNFAVINSIDSPQGDQIHCRATVDIIF